MFQYIGLPGKEENWRGGYQSVNRVFVEAGLASDFALVFS
jgi:hypothetical protein